MTAVSVPASADQLTFSATFFEVTTSSAAGSDFFPGGTGTGTHLAQPQTGLDTVTNMLIYNSTNESGAVGANDYNHGTGDLDWWTPGTYGPNKIA